MATNAQQKDIEQWMIDVANERQPKKKMIYDKKKKMFIPVEPNDPRLGADQVIEFIPEESRRFY
jgi:hypothetical protein